MNKILQGFTDVKGLTTNVAAWLTSVVIALISVRVWKLLREQHAKIMAQAARSKEQDDKNFETTMLMASIVALEPTALAISRFSGSKPADFAALRTNATG